MCCLSLVICKTLSELRTKMIKFRYIIRFFTYFCPQRQHYIFISLFTVKGRTRKRKQTLEKWFSYSNWWYLFGVCREKGNETRVISHSVVRKTRTEFFFNHFVWTLYNYLGFSPPPPTNKEKEITLLDSEEKQIYKKELQSEAKEGIKFWIK